MIVLRNSPTQDDLDQAKKTTHQRPEAEILLYANGWIGDTRGAPIFLDLLDLALSEKFDLKLLIAGRVDGISAPQLLAHTQTIYLGELPQHQALAWYGACDAVLTYYDPSVQINRMAESNKWGDALLLGCPIIVNSEVQTARKLVEGGAALSVNYSDVKGLLELVCRLALDPLFRNSVNESLGSFEYLYPTFDKQFQVIVDRVLSS